MVDKKPSVIFPLGNYEERPEFWDFSVDAKMGDVRVIKDKKNFAKVKINGISYTTHDLYLDTNGSTFWTVQAEFEIPKFEELFDSFLGAVEKGHATLSLGDYKFVSNKEENWELFE